MSDTDNEANLHEFLMFCCKTISNRIGNFTSGLSKQYSHIRANSSGFFSDLSSIPLEESSSCSDFFGEHRGGSRFCGKLSKADVKNIILHSNIDKLLKKKGLDDWYIEFDLSDSFCHYLYLRSKHIEQKDQYIGFLIARQGDYKIQTHLHSPDMSNFIQKNAPNLKMLDIQWLSLQNPEAKFIPSKPRLPGQRYPGSGIGRAVFDVLKEQCHEFQLDGISNVPEYFHNAILYEGFRFLDPIHDAMFGQMKIDLWNDIRSHSLAEVSWAVAAGALLMDGKPVVWTPGEFVLPLSFRLRAYFFSASFLFALNSAVRNLGTFSIDWEKFRGIRCQ